MTGWCYNSCNAVSWLLNWQRSHSSFFFFSFYSEHTLENCTGNVCKAHRERKHTVCRRRGWMSVKVGCHQNSLLLCSLHVTLIFRLCLLKTLPALHRGKHSGWRSKNDRNREKKKQVALLSDLLLSCCSALWHQLKLCAEALQFINITEK